MLSFFLSFFFVYTLSFTRAVNVYEFSLMHNIMYPPLQHLQNSFITLKKTPVLPCLSPLSLETIAFFLLSV